MTTDPILQLVYGTRTLNLNDGSRYALEPGFTPPAALLSVQMSDGTSANRTGGATKIGQRAQNRQWSFSVQCLGSSERDVTRAFQDLAVFMSYAGIDRSVPLYLEYKPNSDINFKPLWGQDGWLRYEVRHANAPQIGDRYGSTDFRARNVTALISIEVAPYAEGLQQRLCTATGGIIEDTIGTVDGISRGLIVAEATCNLFTNPVFGNATWNTGWTAAASLLSASSIDSRYLLPGTTVSAKLTASASTANTFLQDVTLSASQHAIWSVIKLPDGGTPASTMMQMAYNGSTLATAFTSAGNGLWYAVASAIGTAGSASAGVVVKKGYTIYLVAAQAEKKTYRTPLCWGDLLGCAWTSTAHASTSTRTVATCTIPTATALDRSQGTIRVVFKQAVSTSALVNQMFFATNVVNFRAYYSGTGFVFEDGTNTAAYSPGYATAGTLYVFHFVYGPAGLAIYLNGSSVATAATYAPSSSGTSLYIGSNGAGGQQSNSTFFDFTLFDTALTAAQIANDYANQAQVLADGQRLGPVPWLWTKDGDNVVDNCDDSTRDNWCVCDGLPGNLEPKFEVIASTSPTLSSAGSIVLSAIHLDRFVTPSSFIFFDLSGTADANSCGGEFTRTSVSTSETGLTGVLDPTALLKYLAGETVYAFTRLADAGSNLSLQLRMVSFLTWQTDYKPISATSTFYLFFTNGISIPGKENALIGFGSTLTEISDSTLDVYAKRSTGGASNVDVDFIAMLPNPVLLSVAISAAKQFAFDGDRVVGVNSNKAIGLGTVTGHGFNLHPNRRNIIMSFIGDSSHAPTITYTLTYDSIKITPRWGLLA